MPESQPPEKYPVPKNWIINAVIIIALIMLYFSLTQRSATGSAYVIPYSEFKQLLNEGKLMSLTLRGNKAEGTLLQETNIGPQKELSRYFKTHIPDIGDESLLPSLEAQHVELKVFPPEDTAGMRLILLGLLPWILIIAFWFWALNRVQRNVTGGLGGKGELSKFLQGSTKTAEIPDITFDDVAGQDTAKREVTELVEFLKHPSHFRQLGAEVPRGVLLMGPPGTGKTLMAKALAGEAGVRFYSISGSEFIEVFVGVGASRVRHLFEEAKKNSPAIIFIDELDSVGRTRGTGLGSGHDEREQTLNQILAELDGFSGHEAIIVLGATNRPDVLDPAILRPGRFDRHVVLELPDRKDRIAILKVHTRKVPLGDDIVFEQVASGTPGFSGADIKNLVNEAAMLAARDKATKVGMTHFDEARDKLMLGTVRTLAIQPDERHRLAVHESGHALVAHFLPHADPIYKVSIIPRGRALGVTHQLPEHERYTLPEDYLRERLVVMLGGRSAEQVLLDSVSSGADDDIAQATALARAMVSRWGMSKEIGPVDLRDSEEHPFLGREIAQPRHFSENSAQLVDKAVKEFLGKAETRAMDLIISHRKELDNLINELEEHETLNEEQIEACLGKKRLP
ncbi:ATP-dependent zinc metalloprotease FtsH [Photobacterium sp. SDRW27]|uniref:ATP-dependent zinc metalloprotease FtsH n=1 Tax=Photobacterium obscurum TaxID=2829490 RepID=UPI002243858B|nr:ATP-dependent zinc metalloprotease FtsH [Photobacterium obscurum]MCW8327645.1 ATP-dependent zinc metalloprotease FtsH [Photobacterium obscurum]